MNARVVVTGAGGYVGGLLCRAYGEQYGAASVRCAVRNPQDAARLAGQGFTVVRGDLIDPEFSRAVVADTDLVIHAAARLGHGTLGEFYKVNRGISERLARAAASSGARMVLVSTIEAYGAFCGRTLEEDAPHRSNGHPYSDSKYAGEQAVTHAYTAAGSSEFVIVRPGAIYGPGSQYWTHRYLWQAARRGGIGVLGDGGRIFPVFEDDVVDAILAASRHPNAAGRTYNLVNDEGLTWLDWARAHHRAVGRGAPRNESVRALRLRSRIHRCLGLPGFGRRLEVELRRAVIPHERARIDLGWDPRPFLVGMQACEPSRIFADKSPKEQWVR
ncbi:NAD-dependent epimerase/dehydratase family protein (plasmid) [Nocardia sp. NBC_01377]|uniref:NAD-dependent epimerase/dehydratase family protein n=1 Tax=Nocardia sp. NBC_01377 TaxID=2903595 RepID=UPI002F9159A0